MMMAMKPMIAMLRARSISQRGSQAAVVATKCTKAVTHLPRSTTFSPKNLVTWANTSKPNP